MSISDLHSYGEPHDVVADAVAQLRGVTETMWAARSDDDLVATVEHLQQLKSVIAVVEAGAVAEERRLERALAREERAAHTGRFLSIATDGAGGVRVKGRGSAEDGALLKAALLPLTCPEPTVDEEHGDPVRDPREAGARLWDAL